MGRGASEGTGTGKRDGRKPGRFAGEEVIDPGYCIAVFTKHAGKILFLSLLAGILTFSGLLLLPDEYRARAVIAPSGEEQKNLPAIGALASSFGIRLGGPSRIEDLESLFRSNDLTARVFERHDHWSVLLRGRYDSTTGKMKRSIIDSIGKAGGTVAPGKWDAVRAVETMMTVKANPKSGVLTLSFVSTSPGASAAILKDYLDEAKSRLQEEALDRAMKNKKFIEEEIRKTVDAWTRDRLYTLYAQEMEREMMARNREQFGFRIIDSPWVLDRKSEPRRGLVALIATFFSGMAIFAYFVLAERSKGMSGDDGDIGRREMS